MKLFYCDDFVLPLLAGHRFPMGKYARLGERNAARCLGCAAPCGGACPHGVDIRANLIAAHSLLTIA